MNAMDMIKFAGALAVVATSAPTPAAPPVRQPTANWVINFDDAQCVATRNFGTKEEPLFFALKAPAIGDVMQIAVVRSGPVAPPRQSKGKIAFDNRSSVETSLLAFSSAAKRQRIFMINLANAQFAAARTSTSMSISGGDLDESFSLGKIDSVLKVMDECVADLRQVWNVSPSQDASPNLKQRATSNVGRLFSASDYPAVAESKEQQGSVKFVLLVDELGRVADCTIIETSGVAALDAQSCSVVKEKARFTPAIGLDGKPAKDSNVRTVKWQFPD